jgi:hypothetical protein
MLAFSRRMSRPVVANRVHVSEAARSVLEALEPRQLLSGSQIITPVPASQTAAAGSAVSIEVQYSTSDNDNTLTGLGLRMHYDSSKLTLNNLTGVLQTALIGQGSPQEDTGDFDGDPATDRFVLVSWADMMGNWPNAALPVGLYTANFTTSPSLSGSTVVRFSASSTAAGYTLQATPATVTAGVQAPEIVVEYSGTNIADGDSTPSAGEGTDFGAVPGCGGGEPDFYRAEHRDGGVDHVGADGAGGVFGDGGAERDDTGRRQRHVHGADEHGQRGHIQRADQLHE